MRTFAMTVPYMRTSLVHMPRRDLVLASADNLVLRITIVDYDNASGVPITLTGGVGGPSAQLLIWPDNCHRRSWDYGAFPWWPPNPIWAGDGVPVVGLGAFDFSFMSGIMSCWPRRCGWLVQLNEADQSVDVLMSGLLHVRRMGKPFQLVTGPLETDDYIPVHTDVDEPVFT